jgi:hypothetical protein
MEKIKGALSAVTDKLGLSRPLLTRAQRRYKANRRRAFIAHNTAIREEKAADRLRAAGHTAAATRRDKEAGRAHTRAYRNHARAQFWLGRIKALTQRIEGLETRAAQLQGELIKLREARINGNRAQGGTPGKRWRAVCLAAAHNCATGRRRNFYSQSGSWDVHHEIEPGPEYGERSDCSQFVTGVAWSAGLPDPNGAEFTGGYTGTLVQENNGWRQVSLTAMERKGWGYIVYGPGIGHHTEAFIGHGRTVGHGSAPVDFGVPDLFNDGDFRCYIHDPK